jgi:hypothetical protein
VTTIGVVGEISEKLLFNCSTCIIDSDDFGFTAWTVGQLGSPTPVAVQFTWAKRTNNGRNRTHLD